MMPDISIMNQGVNESGSDLTNLLTRLQQVLKVELIEIQAAITAVGNEPARIERYLRDRLGLS